MIVTTPNKNHLTIYVLFKHIESKRVGNVTCKHKIKKLVW